MRLCDFIDENLETIVGEWETFARTIWPHGSAVASPAELRDHAAVMLRSIAHDMRSTQTSTEQSDKSQGRGETSATGDVIDSTSKDHGYERVESGFDLMAVVSEYRALRASVMRLWRESIPTPDAQDIADITRFDEGIDQSLAKAVKSYTDRVSRSRQLFLATLGHDLRNPLNSMLLTSEVIAKSGQLDPELKEMAVQSSATARAMGDLVADLLDFTSAGLGGAMPLFVKPMDLARLARIVVNELHASHPGCSISTNVVGDLVAEWDESRIRQVLSNLLGNALQHGATCRAELAMIDEGPWISIRVQNGGKPIPRSAMTTIFEPLMRGPGAHESMGRSAKGSIGLGLFIARAVVHSHGGTITVTSTAEEGTTFTVRLPRKRKTA